MNVPVPTALVADDEPNLAHSLVLELQRLWPQLQVVHVARNGLEASERISALNPDVAFLDIRMPGMTGLEVAQGIEGPTRVVFVTAFDEFAVQAFEQEALDYVLKPIKAERLAVTVQRLQRCLVAGSSLQSAESASLLSVLERLLPQINRNSGCLRWVRASHGEVTHQVAVEEVLFFQSDDKYTCVRTADRELLIRTPISELIQQLDPVEFVRAHRSLIVNLRHLSGTRRDECSRLFLRFKGYSDELPVSRAYVHLFKGM